MAHSAFSVSDFQVAFEAALAECQLLKRDQAWHFIQKGYVIVKSAFPARIATSVCSQAWRDLRENHDVDARDSRSWQRQFHGPGGIPGYVRTAGSGRRFVLREAAPKAFQALVDVVGGTRRLPNDGAEMAWGDGAVANLGAGESVAPHREQAPSPRQRSWHKARQRSWHKDGWHFRHYLDSPEQGLLVVPIFSNILPNSGGTHIATDSIAPVARLLAANRQGLHADSVQGSGYLIPGLVEQCRNFQELTGEAGDMAVLHPFMLHRPCVNPSPRPRFIANAALVLREPMHFHRQQGDAHSLVELAVLRALGTNGLNYEIEGRREAVKPAPFRDEEEKIAERCQLEGEMAAMAAKGVLTPAWAGELGYMSNADSPLGQTP